MLCHQISFSDSVKVTMAHSRLSKTINAFVVVLCVPGCALAYFFDATLLWQGLAGVILVAIASPNLITNVAVQALGTIGFTIRLKDKAAGDGAQPSSASLFPGLGSFRSGLWSVPTRKQPMHRLHLGNHHPWSWPK